jgi:NAD(P)-dependent dehydrogenase (short-subunit alcohol dehydrogenase family)
VRRHRPGAGGETAELIGKAGGTAVPFKADVSADADVTAMLDAAAENFGRLDVLFNNVGIPTPRLGSKLEDHSVEDFDRLVAVNLRGVFLGCKHAVIRFKRQGGGGVILNTGSVAGLVGWGGTVYGATKGGVHQLTKAVAIEAAPFGIRVNAICPAGMPYTNFMSAGGYAGPHVAPGSETALRVGGSHPLGRPITAEDCAEAAVYLVSDGAANITGVLLPVDGGYVAR